MTFKRFAVVVMMAAIMMLPIAAFASSAYSDEDVYDYLNESELPGFWEWMHINKTAVTLETFTGEVISIELERPVITRTRPVAYHFRQLGSMREFTHAYTIIHVEGEEGVLAFRAHYLFSVFIGDEVAVGDVVTVYYETYRPLTQVYPPQYETWVIVNGDFPNLIISRFDRDGINYDGSLRLDAGDLRLANMDGGTSRPRHGINSIGNMLLVVYDNIEEGVPAVITPNFILDLPMSFRHDSDAIQIGVPDFSAYEVVVGMEGLPGATVARIDDDIYPTHAQLRPVLESFGIEPGWNAITREVTFTNLNGEEVSFRVGSNVVTVGGQVIPIFQRYFGSDLLQRSIIINNSTYVPFDFFIDALGICRGASTLSRERFFLADFPCQCR